MNLREEKILNIIKYFKKNTSNLGKTKLFKLLFYLDFSYFKKHGKTITGYDYYTYPYGPVPKELLEQLKSGNLTEEFRTHFDIVEIKDDDSEFKKFEIILKNDKIDFEVFSKYEVDMLEEIAYIFKDSNAKEMTEASHFHKTPWKTTIDSEGEYKLINIFLAMEKDTPFTEDEILERLELRKNLTHNGYN